MGQTDEFGRLIESVRTSFPHARLNVQQNGTIWVFVWRYQWHEFVERFWREIVDGTILPFERFGELRDDA